MGVKLFCERTSIELEEQMRPIVGVLAAFPATTYLHTSREGGFFFALDGTDGIDGSECRRSLIPLLALSWGCLQIEGP